MGRTAEAEVAALARRIAIHVRLLRKANEWSQEEAAYRCDLAVRAFQGLEAAANVPTLLTLTKLARGFGVELRALLEPTRNRLRPR